MKRLALLCGAAGLCFAPFVSTGQEIRWNTAPNKGFVFQLTNTEAERFLTRQLTDTLINRLLHTQVDTFDVRQGWHNRPEKGHFLLASIVANQLHCEYTSVFPYQVFLLKEYQSLALQVVDKEGNVRNDAVVRLRKRKIRLDTLSQTYRLANAWFNHTERFVTVELEGFRSVFKVTKHEVPDWDRSRNYGDNEGPDFYSYLITDKNKYRPGERVRFKSFALTGQRFLLRRPLEVWMTGVIYKKVGSVEPHRPGSYAGEFYLHDSLELDLDRTYNLQLREKRGRVVANCRFRYEDYELNGDRLEVHLATAKQYHPANNELTILATDANGLLQKGAHASVVVTAINIHETFEPVVTLPDTLLNKRLELDMGKATVVTIPPELFGKANISYEVVVTVHNSQNQTTSSSATAEYVYASHEVKARFSNDSIVYEYFRSGQPVRQAPFLLRTDDEEEPRKVSLPYAEKINATTRTHFFQGDSVARHIALRELVPHLEVTGGIHRDSLQLRLFNPQQLNVSWFVYQGPDLQRQGFGKKMAFDTLITDRSNTYYVEVLYAFGGEDHVLRKEFMFREDKLNVDLTIPDRVYPGQQSEALIEVTDGLGFPVGGVDLTAIGVNGKLGYLLPNLPYYGFTSYPRSKKATFSKDDVRSKVVQTKLDYGKWARRAGLDTMMYYRFAYPGRHIFTHRVAIQDGTQFAPFVMQKGMAVRVHVVEVDHVPAYFDWTDQPKQYSFYVSENKRVSVSLRLHDRVLVLDSIRFAPCHKTILSLDLDRLPAGVTVIPLAPNPRKRWEPLTWSLSSVEENRYASFVSTFRYRNGPVYMEQGKRFVPLFASNDYSHRSITVGPVPEGEYTFSVPMERLLTSYAHEGGYDYKVAGNVVYKLTGYGMLPKTLRKSTFDPMTVINHMAMTREAFMARRTNVDAWHTRSVVLVDRGLEMKVLLPEERARSGFDNILFIHCENGTVISSCRRGSGSSKEYYQIPIGCYDLVALFNNGTYLKMNRVKIQRWTRMVVDLGGEPLQAPDSLSSRWSALAGRDCYPQVERREIRMRQPASYRKGNVAGRVTSAEDGEGLPGVNVLVRGTTNGTVTDADGFYELYVLGEVTLDFSFIGFATESVQAGERSIVDVSMTADVKQLTEVVVTAQGFSRESRALGYSVSDVLMGQIPGVSFMDSGQEPTFPDGEDPEEKQEAEQALYAELLQLSTIRSRFSDVAFWEPKLYTDRKGQSRFSITFPDDITRWEATVYAMNRRLQTGTGRRVIKSYKPILAELQVPNFLTEGDSAVFQGRVLNYTNDAVIKGKVKWTGASTELDTDIQFSEFHLDRLPVHVATPDTLTSRYVFTRDDGYLDGEERKVSVVPQGTLRADGTLSVLADNREITLTAGADETLTVSLLATPVEVFAGEARALMAYRYDCNEQLASKLTGLINYRAFMQYEKKPFRHDREVNKIIGRLLSNQNEEFLWSWWNLSPNTSYWMSAHVLRALRAAADAGYSVPLDISNVTRKVTYKFEFLRQYARHDADLLNALSAWDAKLDYGKYLTMIERAIEAERQAHQKANRALPYYTRVSHLSDLMLLQEVRQSRNLSYRRDSLLKYQREGILGEVYFSDGVEVPYWRYNDQVNANAIAYRIVKKDTALSHLATAMQLYFLHERDKQNWNTYQASNVLQSVFTDLVAGGVTREAVATVRLGGKENAVVNRFPYTVVLQPRESLTLRKETGTPVYVMKYREERVTRAKTGVEGFEIRTTLAGNAKVLEAGKPVTLNVEVKVTKDALREYVMIEIPIPASCSYADKSQRRDPVETHREHFKERTVIFCHQLRAGTYNFDVELLPRFTGSYGVNPAQVSLMYYPVVNANSEMKRVRVR